MIYLKRQASKKFILTRSNLASPTYKQYINNLSQSLHQRSEQELQQSIERLCKYLVIKSEEFASQTILADSYALRYEAGTLYMQCADDPLPIALTDAS